MTVFEKRKFQTLRSLNNYLVNKPDDNIAITVDKFSKVYYTVSLQILTFPKVNHVDQLFDFALNQATSKYVQQRRKAYIIMALLDLRGLT